MTLTQRPCLNLDGLPFAVLRLDPGGNLHSSRHRHEESQIFCLQSGLAVIESEEGRWTVPPGQIGWVPSNVWHIAETHGEMAGWAAYPPEPFCPGLPEYPCVLECSPLIPLIMERALDWPVDVALTSERGRLLRVFMDEVHSAVPVSSRLSFPQHPGLVRVTSAILKNPGGKHDLAHWAGVAAMSERSLGRHFRRETGMSLNAWKQCARLNKARELLADGQSVQECAWSLGYENVSAFIAAFKRMFSQTPSRFGKS